MRFSRYKTRIVLLLQNTFLYRSVSRPPPPPKKKKKKKKNLHLLSPCPPILFIPTHTYLLRRSGSLPNSQDVGPAESKEAGTLPSASDGLIHHTVELQWRLTQNILELAQVEEVKKKKQQRSAFNMVVLGFRLQDLLSIYILKKLRKGRKTLFSWYCLQ